MTSSPQNSQTGSSLVSPAVRWFVLFLLIAGVYFFHGFLVPVLAAIVIGFASWPLYKRIVAACRGNTTLAASVALTGVLLVLVIPSVLLLIYAMGEMHGLVKWLEEANRNGISAPVWLANVPFAGEAFSEKWTLTLAEPNAPGEVVQILSGRNVGGISRWVLAVGAGTIGVLLSIVFSLITLFFIYKDGTKIVAQVDLVGEWLLSGRWERFSRVVPATVSATVTGMSIIAIGEGIVLGLAYKIAGVPSAFILGIITGIMALIPGGAPIAFTSVSIYLVATGNTVAGLALFAWGSIELFIVDKTIRPKLVGGPIRLPFLPTFFGLVGGVKTMGLVGLFVGPIVMALLVAVWREWIRSLDGDPSTLETEGAKGSVPDRSK